MWLPKPLYEALPWVALVTGVALATLAYFVSGLGWLESALVVIGVGIAVAGVVLLLKRRDYRLSRSRIKYDRLD